MLNLDRLNPDWKLATNHGIANRAGKPLFGRERKNSVFICRCCYLPINKEDAPLCAHSKELEFLGFGFPLFYQFLKMCILLLFLSIASYNAMSLRQALESNFSFCHVKDDLPGRLLAGTALKCYTIFVQCARIQQRVTNYEEVLRIISWVVHLFGLMYVRNRLVKLDKYYNERTPTFVDFSIIIKGLPKVTGIQNTLRKFFREQFSSPFEIMNFTLLPQYPDLIEFEKQKKNVIDKLRPYYDKYNEEEFDEDGNNLLAELKRIEQKIFQVAVESKKLSDKDELITSKAICIFNHHSEKQTIVKDFPKRISKQVKKEYFGDHYDQVYILTAPEPQEMIWENVNLQWKTRVVRIFISYALSIVVLVAIFVSIFFILQSKSQKLANAIHEFQNDGGTTAYILDQYNQALALVYVAIFLIVSFNKTVMSTLYHKFTDFQRHTTTSKFQFSFELKLTFGFFFTTALMTLSVEAIRFNNYYSHLYGVIDQESVMFFVNSFFIPLFWIINPLRIIKIIKRKIKYGKKSFTQREANTLMEEDHYDMGKRFAQVIQTMWFTFMYSTLLPLGAIITTVGLCVYYWIDKFNLLRRSTISRQVSGTLILNSLNLLDFTLFLKPVGSMVFDSHLRSQFVPSSLVMLILGVIYVLIPKNDLLTYFNNQKFRQHQQNYKDLKNSLQNTYNTEHPVVRIVHFEVIKTKLSKKGLFLDDQHADMYENQNNGSATHLISLPSVQRNFGSDAVISGI